MFPKIFWQSAHTYVLPYCFHSATDQRSRLWGKPGDRFLIAVLVDQKIKIPAWHCLEDEAFIKFDLYFTFESKLGWHTLFLTVESTKGIRTLVVVFQLMEEMVAWDLPQFCRLNWKKSSFELLLYVFLTVSDLPARFISAMLHVDKSFKMAT